MRMVRTLPVCAVLVLAGCQLGKAPDQMVIVDFHLASADGKQDPVRRPTVDADITAAALTFEGLPFLDEANVALGLMRRNHDVPGGDVEADILRFQLRWHYDLAQALSWYFGAGAGWAFAVDSPRFTSYGGSLYWDLEMAVRYFLDTRFGLQGGVNYGVLEASGGTFTPDSDFQGFTAFLGAFLNL